MFVVGTMALLYIYTKALDIFLEHVPINFLSVYFEIIVAISYFNILRLRKLMLNMIYKISN